MCRRSARALVLAAGMVLAPASACAPGAGTAAPALPAQPDAADRAAARRAYDAGLAAYDRGDADAALAAFLVADDRVPSVEAIDAALLALPEAKDTDLRVRFCDRLPGRALGPGAFDKAAAGCRAVGLPLARLTLRCDGPCEPTVSGRGFAAGTPVVVLARSQRVEVSEHGERGVIAIAPEAGGDVAVVARRGPAGLSPAWFGATLGLAAAFGVGAAVSAAGVASIHDDFETRRCRQVGSTACAELADDGKSAELRTNVLFGFAMAGAAAGVVLSGFTDFGGGSLELSVGARQGRAGAFAIGTF